MEFAVPNAIMSFRRRFVIPVVPRTYGNPLTVVNVERNLLQRRLPSIGIIGGCAATETALALSMRKGCVTYVESHTPASPDEGKVRQIVHSKG